MTNHVFFHDSVDNSLGFRQFYLGLGRRLRFIYMQLAFGSSGAFGGIWLHKLVQLLLETAQFSVYFDQFDLFLLCLAHANYNIRELDNSKSIPVGFVSRVDDPPTGRLKGFLNSGLSK